MPTGMETWITQALTASLEGVCVNTYLVGLPESGADRSNLKKSRSGKPSSGTVLCLRAIPIRRSCNLCEQKLLL